MNKTQEQLEKLREVAESSLNKTEELQKVLAQIEALMSRTENQKVQDKSKEWSLFLIFPTIYLDNKIVEVENFYSLNSQFMEI